MVDVAVVESLNGLEVDVGTRLRCGPGYVGIVLRGDHVRLSRSAVQNRQHFGLISGEGVSLVKMTAFWNLIAVTLLIASTEAHQVLQPG